MDDEKDRLIIELRKILAPLLAAPMRNEDNPYHEYDECLFCGVSHPKNGPDLNAPVMHAAGCPTRRIPELLGPLGDSAE